MSNAAGRVGISLAAFLLPGASITACGTGGSATSSGATTVGSRTTAPAPMTRRIGLCSFSGPAPYPTRLSDGTPDVPTQLGVPLARTSTSPMVAAAYRQFNTMGCTHYQHHNVEVPTRGTYYYDCVGFTSYTLRVADRIAWDSLVGAVHLPVGKVPSPKHYVSFFTGLASTPRPGWSAVVTATGIRPGDLLAWAPEAADAESAGHSVLALSAPVPLGGGRFALTVMDSTATPHGPDDTRRPSNPLSARNAPLGPSALAHRAHRGAPSGLGIGTIALDTGPGGGVTGVEWTIGTKVETVGFASARPLPGS